MALLNFNIPLWAAWVIFIGVGLVLIPVFWFLPPIEDLTVWQKIFSAFMFSSIIMIFVYPLIQVKPQFEWAYVLLILLTFVIPLLFISYKFTTNIERIPSQRI